MDEEKEKLIEREIACLVKSLSLWKPYLHPSHIYYMKKDVERIEELLKELGRWG